MENRKCKVSVFTFNIWALPFMLSKHKSKRLDAIASALQKLDYDIVCFQEVWIKKDYQTLKRRISHIFPFHHFYHSGVNGSGLCTFSKWPIIDTFFFRFSINGYFHMIHHGDWLGGKGIALAQVNVNGFIINVYNTHLHAQYDESVDKYLPHRLIQALEIGAFIKLTSSSSNAVILAGDLNSEPNDLCLKVIMSAADLLDTYNFKQISDELATNECPSNSYTAKSALVLSAGKRIDYILFRNIRGVQLKVKSYVHPLESRVPGTDFSYSDHEAIGCTFDLTPFSEEICFNVMKVAFRKQVLNESVTVCNEALLDLKTKQFFYFVLTVIVFIIIIFISPFLIHSHSYFSNIYMLVMSSFFFFFLIMATIWNQQEVKSIKNARKRIKLCINYLDSEKCSYTSA